MDKTVEEYDLEDIGREVAPGVWITGIERKSEHEGPHIWSMIVGMICGVIGTHIWFAISTFLANLKVLGE